MQIKCIISINIKIKDKMIKKIGKNLSFLGFISFIAFNQTFAAEKKQEKENLNSWLGIIDNKNIQDIICQYLDKWDDQNRKHYDVHLGQIRQIVKADNGKLLGSLSEDGSIKLWNSSRPQNIRFLKDLNLNACCIDISLDSKYLALGVKLKNHLAYAFGLEKTEFQIYDIQNIEKINIIGKKNIDEFMGISMIKFLPTGNYLFAADRGYYRIAIFNISNLSNIKFEYLNKGSENLIYSITSMDYSKNNKYMATSDAARNIIIWDISNLPIPKKISHLIGEERDKAVVMSDLSFSPDNKYLSSASTSVLKIWDIQEIKNIKCIYETKISEKIDLEEEPCIFTGPDVKFVPCRHIKYNSNGKYLTCLYSDFTFRIFNLNNLNNIQSYDVGQAKENDHSLSSFVFSNDDSAIIFGNNDKRISTLTNLAMLLRTKNASTFDRYCNFCNKTENENSKLLRCSRCHKVRYCNSDCQRNDWANHKDSCK